VEDDGSDVVSERINFRVCQTACNEVEGEVEVGQGEKGEHELDELIQELHVQKDFTGQSVVSKPNLLEVDKGVDSGKEGTVEPSTTLGDELRNGIYTTLVLHS
jgi:hypothetical protein